MRKDLVKTGGISSSFLSCEKDIEKILKKLFIESQPHSDVLKRLLVINMPDCLDEENPLYREIVQKTSLSKLRQEGYIKLSPKIRIPEHEEVKAYIIITFDDFMSNSTNDFYRDRNISFDIICHTDYWEMDNYQIRPLKIAGYIDGLINNTKLAGIGTVNFLTCKELVLDENLSGYSLIYRTIHSSDDVLPEEDEG